MIEMEKPRIECVESVLTDNYGRFIVEPLERGFGSTLGNSLRRILLSSLPGSAVTSVRIDGVLHEFSTITGVKEDVTEIVLNLKELAVKLNGETSKSLLVSVQGPCLLTGKDFQIDSDVEIVNPDHVIATLNESGRMTIEITVEKNRGYVTADKNKKPGTSIGIIPMDSVFTPVRRVKSEVENTRVGNMTDFEKLTLEVWTNGTITPEEAVSFSAKILSDYLKLFVGLTDAAGQVEIMITKEEDKQEKLMEMAIEELELSVRSYNSLKRAGINTVGELVQRSESEMMKVRNLGRKSLDEVIQKLAGLGLNLRRTDD